MDSEPWWSTFFDGAALELWRQAIPREVTEREVALLWDLLGLAPGSRVLDVPCGNGRHALELAARGAVVSGLDFSAEFVEEARARALRDGLPATFERRDMRDLDADAAFDAVICMGNSFGYLAGDENVEFLHRAARALAPGGRFVLQTASTAETALYEFTAEDEHETAGMTLRSVSTFDPLRGTQRVEYTFTTKNGSRPTEVKTAEYRIYTVRQLCEILRAAGLVGIEALGDLDGSPFELGCHHVHLLGSKP